MSHELDALPPEHRALLEAEAPVPDVAPVTQARVLARLAATLDLPPAGGGSSDPAAGDGPAPAGGAAASPALARLGTFLSSRVPLAVSTFVLGTAGGAALHATFAPPRIETVVVERAAPARPPPRLPAPPRSERPREASPPAPASPDLPPPRAPRDPDATLAAERVLLERARTALTRGQSAAALGDLSQHRRQFSRGRLIEEREALTVQALAASGRLDEAARRAASFRERWPRSIFRRVVDAATP